MNYSEYPSLIQLLLKTKDRNGENIAFQTDERNISYRQFYDLAKQFSGALTRHQIVAGDRVGLLLPNIPEFVIAYYGILMAGGVVVPINTMFRQNEIKYILKDCECKLVIFSEDLEEQMFGIVDQNEDQLTPVVFGTSEHHDFINWDSFLNQNDEDVKIYDSDPDQDGVILYTSGTTGYPRGAVLSHSNLSSNALACVQAGSVTSQDVLLGILPFYHSFGQTVVMNTCIVCGALNLMLSKFEPNLVIETIQNHKVTILAAVPTMVKILVDSQKQPVDLPSIRLCLSGGAKLDLSIYHDFKDKFNHYIYEGYGLTETSPVVSFNPMDYRSKVGSVGLPLNGIHVKIVDENGCEIMPGNEGEIVVKGPNVMKGYLNKPEATKEIIKDGFFYTGDIGKIDGDGYIYILDRKGDLIIKGGFNVYPKEVEEIISYYPKVREVAVIGVPDPVQGEEVKAYISLKSSKRVSKKEIIEYCQEHMAIYKCPKYITFLHSLPKSSSGRILKRKLFIKKQKGKKTDPTSKG